MISRKWKRLLALVHCFVLGMLIGFLPTSILLRHSALVNVPTNNGHVLLQNWSTPAAKAVLDKSNSCSSQPINLVILVLSSPGGLLRRNVIRSTWIRDASQYNDARVTTRFAIGTNGLTPKVYADLNTENKAFNDLLLISNLYDAYDNLSLKVLVSVVELYSSLEFEYLLKTDDDSYVRVSKIIPSLHVLQCNQLIYWGYFTGFSVPQVSGRWQEDNWDLCPYYLPYALGGGYVLSRKAVGFIARVWKRLKLYHNEDASMGTWLSPYKLIRQHDARFNSGGQSRGCHNSFVITHKVGVQAMLVLHRTLTAKGRLCSTDIAAAAPYTYNWSLPPSQCCNELLDGNIPEEIDLVRPKTVR